MLDTQCLLLSGVALLDSGLGVSAGTAMLPSMTASATLRMVRRRSIDVFWIHRNASGSVSPCSDRLVKVLGDHVYGYEGLPEWTEANTKFRLEITVKDPTPPEPGKKKFKVIKWRWVVERSFAWLGRYRRHSRDYEKLPQTSESMLKISGIQLMLNRLKPKPDAVAFHYPKNQENLAK